MLVATECRFCGFLPAFACARARQFEFEGTELVVYYVPYYFVGGHGGLWRSVEGEMGFGGWRFARWNGL